MQEIPAQAFLKVCTRAVSVFTARVELTQLKLGNNTYRYLLHKKIINHVYHEILKN